MARNYRELLLWQKAMDLVESVYRISRKFPKEEVYGLTSQLRRSAVSVPSNIAEGEGRNSPREFAQYLRISHGSLRELETQVLIAERLSYMEKKDAATIMDTAGDVGRLLNGLLRSLKS